MKTTPLLSLASLFFLLSAFAAATDEVILDSDGDILRNGGTYRLSPIPRIGNGGIFATAIRHGDSDACSLAVTKGLPYTSGFPVTISALVKPVFIKTSYQLLLSFAYVPPNICSSKSAWVVKSANDFEGEDLAAVFVADSDDTLGSLFYIKPYESTSEKFTYKLVVCGGGDLGVCRDVGVRKDNNGNERLVVTNSGEPMVLQFDKIIIVKLILRLREEIRAFWLVCAAQMKKFSDFLFAFLLGSLYGAIIVINENKKAKYSIKKQNASNKNLGKKGSLKMWGLDFLRHSNEMVRVRDMRPSHFSLKIQSYSLLVDHHVGYESGIFEAGGYKWSLVFYPLGKNQSNHISLYLRIKEEDTFSPGWEVDVCFKLFVQDQIQDKYFSIEDDGREIKRFHGMKTEWGFPEFLRVDTFKDPSKGYLVDDSCIFGAEVFVMKCTGKSECFSMVQTPSAQATYTWDIQNFAALCKESSLYSQTFKIGGRSWKLHIIYPEGNSVVNKLSLYVDLVDEGEYLPTNGRVFAKCKLRIKDQLYSNHHERDVSGWCDSLHKSLGYTDFILVNHLKDASMGFILKDSLVVEAQFTLVSNTTTTTPTCQAKQ
ncbi:MATH domain and coiled-coil domain-containing protein [Senna tora]|uniref:MATH domain and coiled-coil domain-containing protein n=1 Tax=Senna tora TaxID=362788 RepID=A0A834TAU0_9FABA|nr:MATH domain and coiled-coil domain-containing protein [Senna tora]